MPSSRDNRLQQLTTWLATLPGTGQYTLEPASADASFRRYFRIRLPNGRCFIVMDAPPEQEDCHPFIDVTKRLEDAGLNVPHIHAADADHGFLLLDDLGNEDYLQRLNDRTADNLYAAAIAALHKLQQADRTNLPRYDETLLQTELNLFTDWFLGMHLQIEMTDRQKLTLNTIHDLLKQNAVEQPQVFVHRDYHSRNLMVTHEHPPGIIDYQDAVLGPITYDLVSLLRDCYIAWPQQQVRAWALRFYAPLKEKGALNNADEKQFLRWFDWMGIQRHLKAIGIFARLNHRDGKAAYLRDIPRTLNYVLDISRQYPETEALASLLQELRVPERALQS